LLQEVQVIACNYCTWNHGFRPMSDTQQSRATLSRNFIAQQSCLSDI